MGKTTLLSHIAKRILAIPPNIDVLLCEQGNLSIFKMLFVLVILVYTTVTLSHPEALLWQVKSSEVRVK